MLVKGATEHNLESQILNAHSICHCLEAYWFGGVKIKVVHFFHTDQNLQLLVEGREILVEPYTALCH